MKRIQDDGTVYWMNSDSQVHREGVPAVIWDEGQSSWMLENLTSRNKKNGRATLDPTEEWHPEEEDPDDEEEDE